MHEHIYNRLIQHGIGNWFTFARGFFLFHFSSHGHALFEILDVAFRHRDRFIYHYPDYNVANQVYICIK